MTTDKVRHILSRAIAAEIGLPRNGRVVQNTRLRILRELEAAGFRIEGGIEASP